VKRRLIIIYFLVFLLFLSNGCSNKFSQYNYTNLIKLKKPVIKKELLSGVFINKEKINRLGDFNIIDKYLVLIDRKSEKMVKIFDIESGELLKSFGKKGQGPSEFIGPSNIIKTHSNINMFCIYDFSSSTIKSFNVKKILNNNFEPVEIIRFKDEIPDQIIISPDNKFFATAITTKGRILEYDRSGKLIKTIGKIPIKYKNKRFAKQHSQGFLGDMIYKNKTNEIFIANLFGSIIEKYNIENGKLLTTYYGPELFFPEYEIKPAGQYYALEYNQRTRWGYVNIDYNGKTDEIYLLYSGRYFFNKKGRANNGVFTNKIYIMNSRGKLAKELILDKKIYRIRLSDDYSDIYGATANEIVKFKYKDKN